MTSSFMHACLAGWLCFLASSCVAGSMACTPMSWSPDGEWLGVHRRRRGRAGTAPPGGSLRCWTTCSWNNRGMLELACRKTDAGLSNLGDASRSSNVVLLSNLPGPTVPTWCLRRQVGRLRGLRAAFPRTPGPGAGADRGRFEVVIQERLDRKRVVWSSADIELDPLDSVWTDSLVLCLEPDGLYLAISWAGPPAGRRGRPSGQQKAAASS